MDEWNRPTPVCRRLSLIQASRGKPIPTGLAPVRGTKARSLEAKKQKKIVIVGISYRHSGYHFKKFCHCITKNIQKLTYNMYTFIICGDINIDLVKYDKDNNVNNYVNDIKSMGCINFY